MKPTTRSEQGRSVQPVFARVACVLGALAVGRVIAHAFLDRRPRYGGAEASDLCNLMFHHYSLQGFFGWTFAEQVTQIGHKPPLYYGGIPWLLRGQSSLSYPPLLLVNAVALGLLLWGCFLLGRRLGGPRGGLFSLAIVAALPAVAGRVTLVGVEILHLAILVWIFELLSRLIVGPPRWRTSLGLGVLLGTGLLIKWTLGVALMLPGAVVLWAMFHTDGRNALARALTLALGLGVGLLSLWLIPLADITSFTSAATGEASTSALLGSSPNFYLLRWTLSDGLGFAVVPTVGVLSVAWWKRSRTSTSQESTFTRTPWLAPLLAASVASVFLVHWFIPHKEPRYVLLAMPGLGILLGAGLANATERLSPRWSSPTWLALSILWVSTFLWPYLEYERVFEGYADQPLHHTIVRYDYGLEQLVLHPTFADPRGSVVSYSLAGDRWLELRDLLSWEFYARNDDTVISRLPSMPTVNADHASRSLDLASHFVTNRALAADELNILAERGFIKVSEHSLPLPSAEAIALWARDRNRADFAESLGRQR